MDKTLKAFQKSFNNYYGVINKYAKEPKKEYQNYAMKCLLSDFTKELESNGKTRHFVNKFIMECLAV